MSIGRAIVENLEAETAITAIVGTDPPRIYPKGAVPEGGPLPRITFQRITTDHGQTLSGANELCDVTFQIDAVADDYDVARDLAELVRLQMMRTTWPGTTAGAVTIKGCRQQGDSDEVERPEAARERGTFFIPQDFAIWHNEPVPA